MKLYIDKPYLWLPVDKNKSEVKLEFYSSGVKFNEIDIKLGDRDCDFYTYMDVSAYHDANIEIKVSIKPDTSESNDEHNDAAGYIDGDDTYLNGKFIGRSYRPMVDYLYRPQLHFTSELGWINDPNGLVYADGKYHLFYQWNPYGVTWGNMHWGHAVSRDMLLWEHKPVAMEPDSYGPVFSGCGFEDSQNVAGFGRDALLFYYTAFGGANKWSEDAGNRPEQRLAVSTDGGDTLVKQEKAVLEFITKENRDPKVFYHRQSGAYIMALYIDGNEFAIYRSENLVDWIEAQRFTFDGMWECPDLFELDVVNKPGMKKWVFWSADGYYLVGEFDGYKFTPESEVQSAYTTKLSYAAQTYSGLADRVVSVAWLRTENDAGNFRGMMAIPAELSLVKTCDTYRISFQPVRELDSYKVLVKDSLTKSDSAYNLAKTPAEIDICWNAQPHGYIEVKAGDLRLKVNFDEGLLDVEQNGSADKVTSISIDREQFLDLKIIIDSGILEFYGQNGTVYGAIEAQADILDGELSLSGDTCVDSVRFYRIGI